MPHRQKCQCPFDCDDKCSNRVIEVECHDEICDLKACSNRYKGDDGVEVYCTEWCGYGLRAKREFHKGDILVKYEGRICSYPPRTKHIVCSSRAEKFLDAKHSASKAKSSNQACSPNCELSELETENGSEVFIVAGETIRPGDEVTIPYGYKITPCYCKAASCRENVAEGMAAARESHPVAQGVSSENQIVTWKNKCYSLYNEEMGYFDGIRDAAIYLCHNLGRPCTEVDVIGRLGYPVPIQRPGPTPSTLGDRTCMLSLKVNPSRLAEIWGSSSTPRETRDSNGGSTKDRQHGGARPDPSEPRDTELATASRAGDNANSNSRSAAGRYLSASMRRPRSPRVKSSAREMDLRVRTS